MKNPARPRRDENGAIVAWGNSTWNPKTRRELPEYADELVNGRRVTKAAYQLIKEKEAKKAEHVARRPLILDELKAEKVEPKIAEILEKDKETRELQKWKNLNHKHVPVPLRSKSRKRSNSRKPVKTMQKTDETQDTGNKSPLALVNQAPLLEQYRQSHGPSGAGEEKVKENADTEMTVENSVKEETKDAPMIEETPEKKDSDDFIVENTSKAPVVGDLNEKTEDAAPLKNHSRPGLGKEHEEDKVEMTAKNPENLPGKELGKEPRKEPGKAPGKAPEEKPGKVAKRSKAGKS